MDSPRAGHDARPVTGPARVGSALTPDEQTVKLAELHDVRRPLVRRHPTTGAAALYLNEYWLAGVDGLSGDASAQLLRQLYAAATAPDIVNRHR